MNAVNKELKINNWHEWFILCNKVSNIIKNKQIKEEELKVFFKEHESLANKAPNFLQDFINNVCWGYFSSSVFWGIIVAIAGSFIKFKETTLKLYLATPIKEFLSNILTSEGFLSKAFSFLSLCILFILKVGLFILPIIIVSSFFQSRKLVKQYATIKNEITALETELNSLLVYIPPFYRNSKCLDIIYDAYCLQLVSNLSDATSYCETYLYENSIYIKNRNINPNILFNKNEIDSLGNESSSSENSSSFAESNSINSLNNTETDFYKIDQPTENDCLHYFKSRIKNNPFLEYQEDGINGVISEGELLRYTHMGSRNPTQELNDIVGLSSVKEQIMKMYARMKFEKNNIGNSGHHMVFTGNPGTGKTTIARIITGLLYEMGYIKENICVEIEGGALKSRYLGQTSEKVKTIIDYARGGVLFIDEAYNMMDGYSEGYGIEAIATLIKYMEDYRQDLVVILAGYKNEIQQLLEINPGFVSRIKTKIHFENYTVDELCQILISMKKDFDFTDDALNEFKEHLILEVYSPEFSNARDIRNWFDQIVDNHTYNWEYNSNEEKNEETKYLITIEDIIPWKNERINYLLDKGYIRLKTNN